MAGNLDTKDEKRSESHDDADEKNQQVSTPTSPSPYDLSNKNAMKISAQQQQQQKQQQQQQQQFASDLVSPTIPPPMAADGQPLYNFSNNTTTNNNINASNKMEIKGQHHQQQQSNIPLSPSFPSVSNSNYPTAPPAAAWKNQQHLLQHSHNAPEINLNSSMTRNFQQELQVIPSCSEKFITMWESFVYCLKGLICLLYTSPSPRDQRGSRMPSSA